MALDYKAWLGNVFPVPPSWPESCSTKLFDLPSLSNEPVPTKALKLCTSDPSVSTHIFYVRGNVNLTVWTKDCTQVMSERAVGCSYKSHVFQTTLSSSLRLGTPQTLWNHPVPCQEWQWTTAYISCTSEKAWNFENQLGLLLSLLPINRDRCCSIKSMPSLQLLWTTTDVSSMSETTFNQIYDRDRHQTRKEVYNDFTLIFAVSYRDV